MTISEVGPRESDSPDAVIGERVRLWQFRRHVTQKRLAEVLRTTPPGVSRRIKGQTSWSPTDLIRVAAFLDVEISDLLPDTLVEQERQRIGLASVSEIRGGETPDRQRKLRTGIASTSAEPRRAQRDSNPQPSDP